VQKFLKNYSFEHQGEIRFYNPLTMVLQPGGFMSSLFREGSLGAILYKSQIITERDIKTALEEQERTGLRFGETLVKLGIVRQEDIDWALSHQLDIPYVRIEKETVDPAVLSLVPASVARQYKLFPIVQIGNELRIAIADPLNSEAIAAVEQVSGCTVAISMGLLREILEMQDYFYGDAGEVDSLGFSSSCFPASVLDTINNDLSGAILLHTLLHYLLQNGFSSISCKPLKESVKVTGKKGTTSIDLGALSFAHYEGFLDSAKELSGINGSDDALSCGTIRLAVESEQVLFQVLLMQTGQWEYITVRPLFTAPFPETLATLETSERNSGVLRRLAALPGGLVLFSSSHAEDRVRLMGACLHEYGKSGKDLLLLGRGFCFCADVIPVLPVSRHDRDMGRWIRATLVHDPDIVAVEEIADTASFTAAFEAVLSGKLLFGGLAASGIRSMLTQLFFLRERLPMLSLYLRGVVACRGVSLLCPDCKEKEASPPPLPLFGGKILGLTFRAKGCPSCRYTGYSGKRFLVESAIFDQGFTDLFDRAVNPGEMMEYLLRDGFHGMIETAGDLVQAGEITAEEYISVTVGNGAQQWPE
jgi:type IV pilus assembly protein PilB